KADTALASLLKRNQERAIPAVDLEPTIPKGVSDIVAKCLERDLNARYQNVQEILDDLDAWAGKRPVSASMIGVAPSPSAIGAAPSRQMPWKWVAIGTLAVAVGAAGWMFRGKLPIGAGAKATQVQVTSLAILPFHNASNDPSLDWLGASLAETLSTDVGQSASLRMISQDSLHQVLRDLQITPGAEIDSATLKQLHDSSNVQTVVSGQYVKVGDQIRIEATLKDLKADKTTKLDAATVAANNPLAVDELA